MDLLDTARKATYFNVSLETLETMFELSKRTKLMWQSQQQDDRLLLIEQHIYLSLLTCHDVEARSALEVFTDLAGVGSSKVAAARSAVLEATESEDAAHAFVASLPEEVDTLIIKKRSLAKYKSELRWKELIDDLLELLKIHPSDVEIWAELSDAYAFTGNFELAAQALLQALPVVPLAYPVYARIAELEHLAAQAMRHGIEPAMGCMESAVLHACRSVELCPTYARGWSLIYIVASKLVQWPKTPSLALYEKLRVKSLERLTSIVREKTGSAADIAAAKAVITV